MRRLDIYTFIFVLLLLVASIFFQSLNKDRVEITSPNDNVRIDSLRFCGAASTSENLRKVSICGSVVADKPSIPIRMYVYEMPSKTLVAQNQVGERFPTGEFIREFDLPDIDHSGSYKIVAYFYKQVVGELDFDVQNSE